MKKIYLKAFDITPALVTPQCPDYMDLLIKSLNERSILSTRVLDLSKLDPNGEEECIAFATPARDVLTGTMIRVKRGAIGQVMNDQLSLTSLGLSQIATHTEESVRGAVVGYSYFCLDKKHAILCMSTIRHKAVEGHFNWLINEIFPHTTPLQLMPMLSDNINTAMSKVKSISINGSALANRPEYESLFREIGDIKNGFLRKLLTDADKLDDIEAEDIVSAIVFLKIKHSKKTTPQREEALKALLRTTDDDAIVVSTTDNKKIRGDKIEEKKEIDIETTSSGYPSEPILDAAMRLYLEEMRGRESAH